ncbi:MAG: DNA repair protein RecN [Muribaculaceae bacterium]|nr:DNA repair protein RecN [Muribaculaceae bacterium]
MLTNLTISNYAIIEHLEIQFHNGFSVITGETGAGKSIILGALMMIFGERVDAKIVNHTEAKSVIEAQFDMSQYKLQSFFEENDLEYDSKICILRREIYPNGRSRSFINDSPVSLSQLKLLSLQLIDINSQHNSLMIGDSNYQLSIIDSLAQNSKYREEYSRLYTDYCRLKEYLATTKLKIAAAKADEDFNKFQLSQFVALSLNEDDADLETKQKQLSNVSDIKETIWQISNTFDSENMSVIRELKNILSNVHSLSRLINDDNGLAERLDSILIEIKDIKSTIDEIGVNIEDNPVELERINQRLSDIYNLKRKHNVSTLDELLQIQKQLELKINDIDNGEFEIIKLEKELSEKEQALHKVAIQLSETRKNAAIKFEQELKERAKPLGMPNIQCKVLLEDCAYTKTGRDNVQFLISFNKKQPLLPIGNSASGGEISRIMLCAKTIVATKMHLPTVLFDEIDTGVSGEIANKMGEMMLNISKEMQVVAITHLPQVASLGDNHYKVFKKDALDATKTSIKELSIEERVLEIAGMLGGNSINEAAINNAKSLLKIN